jgi:hypothetical protein
VSERARALARGTPAARCAIHLDELPDDLARVGQRRVGREHRDHRVHVLRAHGRRLECHRNRRVEEIVARRGRERREQRVAVGRVGGGEAELALREPPAPPARVEARADRKQRRAQLGRDAVDRAAARLRVSEARLEGVHDPEVDALVGHRGGEREQHRPRQRLQLVEPASRPPLVADAARVVGVGVVAVGAVGAAARRAGRRGLEHGVEAAAEDLRAHEALQVAQAAVRDQRDARPRGEPRMARAAVRVRGAAEQREEEAEADGHARPALVGGGRERGLVRRAHAQRARQRECHTREPAVERKRERVVDQI